MTEEQRKQYLANFKRATEKWSGLLYEPFPTEEARQEHLRQVKEAQAQGAPF